MRAIADAAFSRKSRSWKAVYVLSSSQAYFGGELICTIVQFQTIGLPDVAGGARKGLSIAHPEISPAANIRPDKTARRIRLVPLLLIPSYLPSRIGISEMYMLT